MMPDPTHQPGQLKRQLGLFHAVMLGLGSILGTGVFVSIGIAAGIAGPAVLIAIILAALLALCNGLSSAQLAAAHPVAGGTYEYAYKYLHPKLGFTAGWMFLLAKSASAATAALGVSAFFIIWLDATAFPERYLLRVGSILVIVLLVAFTLIGIRPAAWLNAIIVSITLLGLFLYITGSATQVVRGHDDIIVMPVGSYKLSDYLFEMILAVPLIFVAYTGYGRIATLSEEVHHPRRTIPRAIIITLVISCLLYFCVGLFIRNAAGTNTTWLGNINSEVLNVSTFLLSVDRYELAPTIFILIFTSAITAMLGVLLNLVLGLSRVLLAMGRRRDMPGLFAKVNDAGTTPVPAVIGVGILIAGLTLVGDVKTTWSFAAFTVLIYYGITNLAALRLPVQDRLYPRAFSYAGLGGCLFLCWWVQPIIWIIGLVLIALGLIWHALAPKMFGLPPLPRERCTQCGYDLRASTGACPECGAAIVQEEG